jgi:hypothetical protein
VARRTLVAALVIGALFVSAAPASASPTLVSVQCSPAPANCDTWYRGPVTVKWLLPAATDVLAGTCVLRTFQADTPGTKIGCTAWEGLPGTGSTTVDALVRIDATPPSVFAVPDRPPDANGWFNHPVGIAFAGSDATSGVAACDRTAYGGPDGGGVLVSGSCRDVAGNVGQGGLTLNYDATAPAAPKASARPDDRAVELDWSVPGDVATVEVVRLTNAASSTLVFRGAGDEFVDRSLRNGARYRYELTAIDQAGNSSRSSVSAVPTSSPLLEPARGSQLVAPPALVWEPVKRAAYYNVQLYRGSRKLLSAWPAATTLKLARSWRYAGKPRRLAPGRYRWLVWPGFGKRSERRYGKQLGASGFRVVR